MVWTVSRIVNSSVASSGGLTSRRFSSRQRVITSSKTRSMV